MPSKEEKRFDGVTRDTAAAAEHPPSSAGHEATAKAAARLLQLMGVGTHDAEPSRPTAEPTSDFPLVDIKGQAFVKGDRDASDIQPNDVMQGSLGDCWFMAAVAAVARANPEAIRRLIKENGDDTYDVTLYLSDFWHSRRPVVIRVDSKFPGRLDRSNPALNSPYYAKPGNFTNHGPELWVMLLEKAYAQHKGGYNDVEGGWGFNDAAGLELLLPETATMHHTAFTSEATMLSQITQAMAEGRPVIASAGRYLTDSTRERARQLHIEHHHSYAVKSTNPRAKTISLQNPWGCLDLDDLSMDDFNLLFSNYSIGPKA